MLWLVLAEDTTTVPGPAGLLGLLGVLATGVSVLLGIVVKWLLSHITDLTKQTMDLVTLRDRAITEMQRDYKDSLAMVVSHCDKEIGRQVEIQKERDAKLEAVISRQVEALEELKDVISGLHAKLLTS